MAFTTGLFLFALLYTASCNPLGQTTCETIMPNIGTTVCESTPNILANLGLGLGPLGLNLPSSLGLQLLSQTMVPSLGAGVTLPGQTTVCESTPNLSPLSLPYGLNLPGGLVNGLNLPGGLLNGLNFPGGLANSLSFPSGLVNSLSLPGGITNALNLPGSTTVCESSPNAISSLGLPVGLSGLNLQRQLGGFGLPVSGLGLPLNGLGLPLNGLGLPLSGLGLPLNGLAGLAVGPLGLPLL